MHRIYDDINLYIGRYGTFCDKKYSDTCNTPTNLVSFKTRNSTNSEVERVNIIGSVYQQNFNTKKKK